MGSQDRGRPLPKFGELTLPQLKDLQSYLTRPEMRRRPTEVVLGNLIHPEGVIVCYKESESFQYPRARKSKWLCCG